MVRTLVLAALLVVGASSCGHGASPPPGRSSPALQLVAVASIDTSDPRTGMLVVGNIEQTVARADATTLTTLSPALPDPASWTPRTLRWFTDGAWVADFTHDLQLDAGAWRAWHASDCVAGVDGTLVFLDARANADAWATLTLASDAQERLCHFDGTAWTAEDVAFSVDAMVVLDDTLVALTSDSPRVVMRRPLSGGTWTAVALDFDAAALTPAAGGALVDDGRFPPTRALVTGTGVETILDGVVLGIGSERWSYDATDGAGERCGVGIGGPPCYAVHDWAQYVVYDGVGTTRTEVAHLDVYARDFGGDFADLSARFFPVGPGRVGAVVGDHLWAMSP